MDIRDFYTHLLGLASPWTVKAVIPEEKAESVNVHLECAEAARLRCALCDRYCPVCEFSTLMTWRHLDTCGMATYLHARLPIVNCSEHGRQYSSLPWAHADSPATLAFEQWVARLAEGFADTRKTARFLGIKPAHLRHILRQMAEGTGKAKDCPEDADEGSLPPSGGPEARQLTLFGRNDLTFVNQGIQAYKKLEIEKAVELFQKHRSAYPRGQDITSRLAAADFLLRGFREAPSDPLDRPAHFCRLWNAFEDYVESEQGGRKERGGRDDFAAEVKRAFFVRVAEEAGRGGSPVASFLPGDIPLGYILLQAGRYEEAIRSLQDAIATTPHNPALYGYLGDAYSLRGDSRTARQCYREACLIDPGGIDWRHLVDEELKELKQDILLEYGLDPELALAWLPSHARIEGLFEPKVVRLHDGLKEMVDDYLSIENSLERENTLQLKAKLFFRGLILCENREPLKFVKKIDLIQVRRMMKQANPDLFADFLETIVEGKGVT